MKKYPLFLVSFILFFGLGFALEIHQSFSEDEMMEIHVHISERLDSDIVPVDGVCENFTTSKFYSLFSGVSCDETQGSIVIRGYREIDSNSGFQSEKGFIESTYNYNFSGSGGGLVGTDSLAWGAVPLKVDKDQLASYDATVDLVVEMPGEISIVRNGDISSNPKEASFDLANAFYKKRVLYVQAKSINWKSFSSMIIFFIMVVGITIVWLSFFYLKSKT